MPLKLTETMDRTPDDSCYAECAGCGVHIGPYTNYLVTEDGDAYCCYRCARQHAKDN